eukprot:6457568-Amphidinium_carterae.1
MEFIKLLKYLYCKRGEAEKLHGRLDGWKVVEPPSITRVEKLADRLEWSVNLPLTKKGSQCLASV